VILEPREQLLVWTELLGFGPWASLVLVIGPVVPPNQGSERASLPTRHSEFQYGCNAKAETAWPPGPTSQRQFENSIPRLARGFVKLTSPSGARRRPSNVARCTRCARWGSFTRLEISCKRRPLWMHNENSSSNLHSGNLRSSVSSIQNYGRLSWPAVPGSSSRFLASHLLRVQKRMTALPEGTTARPGSWSSSRR
jgi:hypothetical protein